MPRARSHSHKHKLRVCACVNLNRRKYVLNKMRKKMRGRRQRRKEDKEGESWKNGRNLKPDEMLCVLCTENYSSNSGESEFLDHWPQNCRSYEILTYIALRIIECPLSAHCSANRTVTFLRKNDADKSYKILK